MPSSPNPYIAGPPLDADANFFGREDILQAVEHTLRYPNHNAVILYGQRKIGKTSLLLQLEEHLPTPPFFTVYFDPTGKEMLSVGQILFEMATVAAKKVGSDLPQRSDFDASPDAFHKTFLPALYEFLGPQQQPVFLLDEFEALDIPESDLPENVAIRSLDTYLLGLLTSQSYTDFIFAAGRRMEELEQVPHSSYHADLTRYVPVLNPDQAEALIRQEDAPEYDDEAVAKIIELTRGHPYLTQLVCAALASRIISPVNVTVGDVEAVVPGLLTDTGNETLPAIWHSIPPVESLVLAAAAGLGAGPAVAFSQADIEQTLSQADVFFESKDTGQALEKLVNWQILEQVGERYQFFIDFIRRWIAKNRPLHLIRSEELGWLNPKVVGLYGAALRANKQDKPAQAIAALQQLLAIAAGFVPGLMLLGWLFMRQNDPAQAVESYEQAYRQQPPRAKNPLTNALVNQAQSLEKAGNTAGALAAYDRVLEIAPNHQIARQRREALQTPPSESEQPKDSTHLHQGSWSLSQPWPVIIAGAIILLLLYMFSRSLPPSERGGVQPQLTETGLAALNLTATAAETAPVAQASTATPIADPPVATPEQETAAAPTKSSLPVPTATPTQKPATADAPQPAAGSVQVVGAAAMVPLLDSLATAYAAGQPNFQIEIEGSNSAAGIEAIRQGVTDIAMIGRDLSPDELAALGDVQLFSLPQQDTVAVIAHPLAGATNLSSDQVRQIFAGAIANWSDLDGPNAPIQVVSLAAGADTRAAFEQQIMGQPGQITPDAIEVNSDQQALDTVSNRPYAIGYVTIETTSLNNNLPLDSTANWSVIDTTLALAGPLAVDQVAPSAETIASGEYPYTRPLNLLTAGTPGSQVQDWINFIYSPEGQRVIETARQEIQ